MSCFLYENHWGSPTLTLLNVLGVLGVLHVLHVLHMLHVLNMPMDASLACWALFLTLYMERWMDQQTYLPIEMQFYISVMFLGLPDDIHEEKPSFLQ